MIDEFKRAYLPIIKFQYWLASGHAIQFNKRQKKTQLTKSQQFNAKSHVNRQFINKNTLEVNLEIATLTKIAVNRCCFDILGYSVGWFTFKFCWVFGFGFFFRCCCYCFCTFMVFPNWRQYCKIFVLFFVVAVGFWLSHDENQTRLSKWKPTKTLWASWINRGQP